jgi:hypothetical protein
MSIDEDGFLIKCLEVIEGSCDDISDIIVRITSKKGDKHYGL